MGGWFSSLRARLLLLVLIAVLPAFGIILWTSLEQRSNEQKHAEEVAVQLTRLVATQQHTIIEGARQLFVGLAGAPQILGGDAAGCRTYLAGINAVEKRYIAISLAAPNGDIVCSSVTLNGPVNLSDREYVQRMLQTRQFTTGQYVMARGGLNVPTLPFAYPLTNQAGEITGILVSGLDLTWLTEFAANVSLPEDTTLTVLDRDGVVMARRPDPEIWVGKTVADRPMGRTVLSVGEGTAELPGLDGKQRLFAFAPLGGAGTHDAYVAVGISTATAYAGINRTLIRNLSLLGGVAVLALLAAWFGGEWFILRSMRVLVGASQRVGAGDLNARSGLAHDRGEIGQLAGSFDEMAEALQRRETERNRAEDALREIEERFRLLVDGVSDYAILMLDPHGRVMSWNSGAERIKGYTSDEIIGKHFSCFYAAEDIEQGKPQRELQIAAAEGRFEDENWRVRKDGSRFWANVVITPLRDSGGQLRGFAKITKDMTERKQAEAALRESEGRFRSFVEHSVSGIFMVDEQGRIVSTNPAAERMFGYQGDEIVGRPLETLLPDRFRTQHAAHCKRFWEAPAARPMRPDLDLWAQRKDGGEFPVAINLSPLDAPEGRLVAASISDITEQKRAGEQLEQIMQDLKRSNAELEQFAYVASHDLQEPLRMVGNYTQLLARRYEGKLDADADDFINYAVDGAKRMQTLINDLLAFSRVGTRGKEVVATDAEAVLVRTLRDLGAAAAESGVIITHDPLPIVLADDGQLGQVFQNLIGNAIRFRGDGPARIHVSAQRNGSGYVFSVNDNGIGISPEYFERIFVIFQRLHGRGRYPGTGIGLAVCKKIVERHGGRIWVESEPGQGATFYFTLPAIAESTPHLTREKSEAAA
jgi:PAS domain S-box-containing protein